jgi:hypothetical protein
MKDWPVIQKSKQTNPHQRHAIVYRNLTLAQISIPEFATLIAGPLLSEFQSGSKWI